MSQLAGDRVARDPFAAAPATPLVGLDDTAGEDGSVLFGSLPDDFESELVQPRESSQIRAGEARI